MAEWVSLAEAARRLRVSERTVRRRIASGAVTARRDDGALMVMLPAVVTTSAGQPDTPPAIDSPPAAGDTTVTSLLGALKEAYGEVIAAREIAATMVERNRQLAADVARLEAQLALPAPEAWEGAKVPFDVASRLPTDPGQPQRPWWRRLWGRG